MHREIYHESMDLKVTKGNVNGGKREMTNGQAVSMLEKDKGYNKTKEKVERCDEQAKEDSEKVK